MTGIESTSKIAVLGGGESGTGAALLARAKGLEVFLSDAGRLKEEYRAELQAADIVFEEGGHTEEKILGADILVKSPGIPDEAALLQRSRHRGIETVSEIEFASRFDNRPIIAITGTNGKTTTTALIAWIFENEGRNVGLGGNIGKSFARLLAEEDPKKPYELFVLEISSFQLDNIRHFRPYIGVLTNITPDHLDRYGNQLQRYIDAKFRLIENSGPGDWFIYNLDDELTTAELSKRKPKCKLLPFSLKQPVFPGAYRKDDTIKLGIMDKEELNINTEDLALPGQHNQANSMAAGLAARIMEIRKDTIRESLRSFQSVEHRLEAVRTVGQVDYVNDSKATNVNAAWYALESMKKPVIWVAGGYDKGNDYSSLKPLVREKVKAIVCIGRDNRKIREAFGEEVRHLYEFTSMKEAVAKANELASAGDAVLLAPACASYDLFVNYEDRGKQFKQAVNELG